MHLSEEHHRSVSMCHSPNFKPFVIGLVPTIGLLMYIPHTILVIYSYLTCGIYLVYRVSPLLTVLGFSPSDFSHSPRGILTWARHVSPKSPYFPKSDLPEITLADHTIICIKEVPRAQKTTPSHVQPIGALCTAFYVPRMHAAHSGTEL